VESRDFVEKLEIEQRQRQSRRHTNDRSMSPLATKQPARGDYMDRINELGTLENTLLQCNITKNKVTVEPI